jgi:hypothetical protein
VTVWHDVVAFLTAVGALVRTKIDPEVRSYDVSGTAAPRSARRIAMEASWEEDRRLLG